MQKSDKISQTSEKRSNQLEKVSDNRSQSSEKKTRKCKFR